MVDYHTTILPPHDIEVVYVDGEIVVVVKPGGMLAVPGRGPDKQDCVATRLRTLYPEMIAQPAIHRLDMFTSGLMVFAMTTDSHRHLSEQFAERMVEKRYLAVLEKDIEEDEGKIELAFRLDPANRPRQIYDPVQGKRGITSWCKVGGNGITCTVEMTPLTGRTHQLRLHAAHRLGLNAPIVGDSIYGLGKDGDRMHLHATRLSFLHPVTKERKSFESQPHFATHRATKRQGPPHLLAGS